MEPNVDHCKDRWSILMILNLPLLITILICALALAMILAYRIRITISSPFVRKVVCTDLCIDCAVILVYADHLPEECRHTFSVTNCLL